MKVEKGQFKFIKGYTNIHDAVIPSYYFLDVVVSKAKPKRILIKLTENSPVLTVFLLVGEVARSFVGNLTLTSKRCGYDNYDMIAHSIIYAMECKHMPIPNVNELFCIHHDWMNSVGFRRSFDVVYEEAKSRL